jgi:hypothetical protein
MQGSSGTGSGTIKTTTDYLRDTDGLPNALPFTGAGAAKPAPRFYADVPAATTSVLQRLVGRPCHLHPRQKPRRIIEHVRATHICPTVGACVPEVESHRANSEQPISTRQHAYLSVSDNIDSVYDGIAAMVTPEADSIRSDDEREYIPRSKPVPKLALFQAEDWASRVRDHEPRRLCKTPMSTKVDSHLRSNLKVWFSKLGVGDRISVGNRIEETPPFINRVTHLEVPLGLNTATNKSTWKFVQISGDADRNDLTFNDLRESTFVLPGVRGSCL